MKALLGNGLILGIGIWLGWMLRDFVITPTAPQEPLLSAAIVSNPSTEERTIDELSTAELPQLNTSSAASASESVVSAGELQNLFSDGLFEEAATYYDDALRQDSSAQIELRPVVMQFIKSCSSSCATGDFIELVEVWLSLYYDDIDVLLLLADFQSKEQHPEAAADTLALADQYAHEPGGKVRVQQALAKLTASTDKRLAGENRWIELVGFYEYLQALGQQRPAFELRLALLYLSHDEPRRGHALLLKLQEEDDGSDPQWSERLALILEQPEPEVVSAPIPANAVPLRVLGNQFLVDVQLNERETVTLLIDTGASITTLTSDSFNALQRQDFGLLGSRMFSTANGFTRGDVYRSRSLRLGENRLDNTNIAVLNYRPPNGVNGLLGMNVLRNFRFEIDQENALLHLRPR